MSDKIKIDVNKILKINKLKRVIQSGGNTCLKPKSIISEKDELIIDIKQIDYETDTIGCITNVYDNINNKKTQIANIYENGAHLNKYNNVIKYDFDDILKFSLFLYKKNDITNSHSDYKLKIESTSINKFIWYENNKWQIETPSNELNDSMTLMCKLFTSTSESKKVSFTLPTILDYYPYYSGKIVFILDKILYYINTNIKDIIDNKSLLVLVKRVKNDPNYTLGIKNPLGLSNESTFNLEYTKKNDDELCYISNIYSPISNYLFDIQKLKPTKIQFRNNDNTYEYYINDKYKIEISLQTTTDTREITITHNESKIDDSCNLDCKVPVYYTIEENLIDAKSMTLIGDTGIPFIITTTGGMYFRYGEKQDKLIGNSVIINTQHKYTNDISSIKLNSLMKAFNIKIIRGDTEISAVSIMENDKLINAHNNILLCETTEVLEIVKYNDSPLILVTKDKSKGYLIKNTEKLEDFNIINIENDVEYVENVSLESNIKTYKYIDVSSLEKPIKFVPILTKYNKLIGKIILVDAKGMVYITVNDLYDNMTRKLQLEQIITVKTPFITQGSYINYKENDHDSMIYNLTKIKYGENIYEIVNVYDNDSNIVNSIFNLLLLKGDVGSKLSIATFGGKILFIITTTDNIKTSVSYDEQLKTLTYTSNFSNELTDEKYIYTLDKQYKFTYPIFTTSDNKILGRLVFSDDQNNIYILKTDLSCVNTDNIKYELKQIKYGNIQRKTSTNKPVEISTKTFMNSLLNAKLIEDSLSYIPSTMKTTQKQLEYKFSNGLSILKPSDAINNNNLINYGDFIPKIVFSDSSKIKFYINNNIVYKSDKYLETTDKKYLLYTKQVYQIFTCIRTIKGIAFFPVLYNNNPFYLKDSNTYIKDGDNILETNIIYDNAKFIDRDSYSEPTITIIEDMTRKQITDKNNNIIDESLIPQPIKDKRNVMKKDATFPLSDFLLNIILNENNKTYILLKNEEINKYTLLSDTKNEIKYIPRTEIEKKLTLDRTYKDQSNNRYEIPEEGIASFI